MTINWQLITNFMTLQDEYSKLVASGKVYEDTAQKHVLAKLEALCLTIEKNFAQNNKIIKKIVPFPRKNHGIKGLYIHGAVGRGKSMLMDLFFCNLDIVKKKRVHFHAFMIDIHAQLHAWRNKNRDNRNSADPLPAIARNIALHTNVLCFDEMQVNDIADAMILGRLFAELLKNGVVIVATSNRHPDALYKDGLQREHFLPFIAMVKERLDVMSLEAKEDYRLAHLKSLECVYYSPLDQNAEKFLRQAFAKLTGDAAPSAVTIDVAGRELSIAKAHGDVAWSSFKDLCEKPLGAADYIGIAREFSTLLLEGIPQMGAENRNEAKRFITLIDELYEHKVHLIATAATTPDMLYKKGDGSFEFSRTISRLIEMQSEKYMVAGHLV